MDNLIGLKYQLYPRDKHTTIYDSYDRELASQMIKSLQLSNFTEIYNLTNEKNYSIDNLTQKHLLYKQFVAWNCYGSSVAPLTEYMDNLFFKNCLMKNRTIV